MSQPNALLVKMYLRNLLKRLQEKEEAVMSESKKVSTGDSVLDWMYANLPPEQWTLKSYVEINWMGDKTVAEVLEDAELVADLPQELWPEPQTGWLQ